MSDTIIWIVAWGVVATGSAALAGILAGMKNRDYSFWMGWSFLFPPMVIILAFLPAYKGRRPTRPSLDEEDKHIY